MNLLKKRVTGKILAVALCASFVLRPDAASGDWLQFNGNPQHDGNNKEEKVITINNVAKLAPIYQISLPGIADGCPVYLRNVSTKKGPRNMLYVTTKEGHIVALDAATGEQLWMSLHPAGDCRVNNGFFHCYTTASPAIDPDGKFVYTYGLDGYVHKHRTDDGDEIKEEGWPALTTRKPNDEKGSSNLSIATDKNGISYLYAAHAAYPGDRGDYQGHITVINLSNGKQRVFNANCSNRTEHFAANRSKHPCPVRQTGIWPRAGIIYDKSLDRIFTTTGNGPFEPNRYNWGNSVLALNPDGTGLGGKPLDSYTPVNFAVLNNKDLDLGSSAPVLVPVPDKSKIPHLAIQPGKDSLLRLLNLENLNGHKEPGHTGGEIGKAVAFPQGGEILTIPAMWVNPADSNAWVFIANKKGISAFKVDVNGAGIPFLKLQWKLRHGGTSPLIANNILYYASSHHIRALNLLDGKQLWSDTSIGSIHWQSPIVADGILYVTDDYGQLTAFEPNPFSLKGGTE
jgi:outer membrane protein assembly factor BamB